jgi:1,4-dihydroxy-2-naphthoyl-CoA hydrolase
MIPKELTPDHLNLISQDTILTHLGISFTDIGENYITAKMPVNTNTSQPMGLLHGGASVTLAESIGSIGSYLMINKKEESALGIEINANHVGSAYDGFVIGKGIIVHKGKTTHIWNIEIRDEKEKLISLCRLTVMIIKKASKK